MDRRRDHVAEAGVAHALALPAEDPWSFLERVAERRDTDAQALYSSERLRKAKLRQSPLD